MGLYQAHFFKTRHLELGFLTYLLEVMPKGAVFVEHGSFDDPNL